MLTTPKDSAEPLWRRMPWIKLAAGAAALAVLLFVGSRLGAYVPAVAERIDRMGAWGPVAFVGAYIVADLLLIPGALMSLAGGASFGLLRGSVVVFVAATVGAVAAFLVARYIARGLVERRLASAARLQAIDRAISSRGFRLVVLLRLSPAIPYALLNYTLGLTRVRFRDFLLGSIGMLPGTILYVYYGKLAGDVAALAGGATVRHDTAYWLVLGTGLIATIVATVMVTRVARRALKDATEDSES